MAAKEDFKITNEEADKLKKALKDEEFRKLLGEYAQEISDPENKRKFEEELTKLEQQRGVDVKFVHPNPGFVLKTFILPEGKTKVFVNICHSDAIDKASSSRDKGNTREKWSIPLSLAPPRDDLDKSGNKCSVIDAVFHPDTYQKGQQNPRFKQMLIDTVFDMIENQIKTKLDRKNVIFLRMPYKGMPSATVMRQKSKNLEGDSSSPDLDLPFKVPYPPLKEDAKLPKKQGKKKRKQKKEKQPCEPEYSVVHRGGFSMQDFTNERESTRIKRPEHLVVTVNLPGVESASGVDLDIFEKRLVLECTDPLYKLDLALPYPIDEDKGSAKFNKSKQALVITLPVLPQPEQQPTPHLSTPTTPLITELYPPQSTNETQAATLHDEQKVDSEVPKPEAFPSDLNNDQLSVQESDSVEEGRSVPPHVSVAKEWTATGDWKCPPFSYRQDESNVCFVLHTPEVKKPSLVTYFDEQYAQLTYKTENGQNYSFYVSFPDGCVLDADDCSADVSPENMVLLMKKATSESGTETPWERFTVGLNASQTTEKLFLTVDNVQSAVEELNSLPDPWTQKNTWSESAVVKVKSVSEEKLVVEISDPSKPKSDSGMSDKVNAETVSEVCSGEKDVETVSSTNSELIDNPKEEKPVHNGHHSETSPLKNAHEPPVTVEEKECEDTDQHSTSSETNKTEDVDLLAGGKQVELKDPPQGATVGPDANVIVEKDGSVFIKADDEYLKRRYEAHKSKDEDTTASASTKVTKGCGIQLSNQLIYSLD